MSEFRKKVLYCGQIKTGTKSMSEIFRLFGFKVNRNPICLHPDYDYILLDNDYKFYKNSIINETDNIISSFEAFHDYPYSYNYEYIHSLYPDTYFILTIRNDDDWFNSLLTYQKIPFATNKDILKKLYNHEELTIENKEEIINKYNEYNNNILFFFKNNPNLLVINICNKNYDEEDEIMYKIKQFLNIDLNLEIKLPHINKQ